LAFSYWLVGYKNSRCKGKNKKFINVRKWRMRRIFAEKFWKIARKAVILQVNF